ncbi:ArsR/SmtB family transcription factor [Chloroflexota bacterium]
MLIEEEAEVFRALADPTRLKLFKLLCHQRVPDALCVNALAELLGVSQAAVSQHLKVLKNIRLVKGERRGYHIHYSVDREALERYRNFVVGILVIEEVSEEQACENSCPIRRKENVSLK